MTQTLVPHKIKNSIHPATRIGSVSLTVSNLEKQVSFYEQVMGFQLRWREGSRASLGTSEKELLRLVEYPIFKRYGRVTGLYHFAILYPDQRVTGPRCRMPV